MRARILGVLLVLAFVGASGAFAQENLGDLRTLYDTMRAEQARQATLAAIEADRAGFVRRIAQNWVDHAVEAGFTDGWWAEFEELLSRLPAEKLLRVSQATSYGEVRRIMLGGGVGTAEPAVAADDVGILQLGSETGDLVYTPVTPCRIVDTRGGTTPGVVPAGTMRSYYHHDQGSGGQLAAQGGNAAGCGIPTDPAALAINITVLGSTGTGWLTAWAYLGTKPYASVINYTPGAVLANTTIVPMCQVCGADFNIQADGASTYVIVDVMGYFWSPTATPLDVTTVTATASPGTGSAWDVTATCPAGRTLTGGGVDWVGASTGVWVWQSAANAARTGWQTRGTNASGNTITVAVSAQCAAVPGR